MQTLSGLIISYFGNSVAVEADDGQVFQCHLRRNQELPVVGDRVEWVLGQGNTGTIEAILPRKSLLARGDARGKMKPIAANIDAIVIVMAPPPIFTEYLVDRYLIAAELLKIQPIIVINKIDLLDEKGKNKAHLLLDPYRKIGYPIVFSSVFIEDGLEDLKQVLQKKLAVLVGPSGVGKSSIIAALSEGLLIRIGDVTGKGIGKHTTTATRLYHLPNGGSLIDSPGVREFNLWPIKKQEILASFHEFDAYKNECKFRDCSHLVEPGCAVQAAVSHDKISAKRYSNYQELMKMSIKE
ncbi:MAG: hypothetical protein ACD_46C00658G0004 [uncultured bacterium]|nr:MAG: hypothetical protein ACD_46C00658G0004 [uncultured bacterium]